MAHRILILGGSFEARQFARAVRDLHDLDVTLSLAGRTAHPLAQPVPVRVGGFGGARGLARYLRSSKTEVVIDATHPFANVISENAINAAAAAGVKLIAIRRPAWQPIPGDHWTEAESVPDAVRRAGPDPRRILVALGRKELGPLTEAPWHSYLIRSIDPVDPPLGVPDATYILARGPFDEDGEIKLFRRHRIELIIAKNSGGTSSYAKLAAARRLSLPAILVKRPTVPAAPSVPDARAAKEMLVHLLGLEDERGE